MLSAINIVLPDQFILLVGQQFLQWKELPLLWGIMFMLNKSA